MPDINADEFLNSFLARVRCCACGRLHPREEIQVLNRRGESWLLKVYCPTCRTRSLVVARISDEPSVTPRESTRDQPLPPLTMDDVLDIHLFLRDFQGDVDDLLRRR